MSFWCCSIFGVQDCHKTKALSRRLGSCDATCLPGILLEGSPQGLSFWMFLVQPIYIFKNLFESIWCRVPSELGWPRDDPMHIFQSETLVAAFTRFSHCRPQIQPEEGHTTAKLYIRRNWKHIEANWNAHYFKLNWSNLKSLRFRNVSKVGTKSTPSETNLLLAKHWPRRLAATSSRAFKVWRAQKMGSSVEPCQTCLWPRMLCMFRFPRFFEKILERLGAWTCHNWFPQTPVHYLK